MQFHDGGLSQKTEQFRKIVKVGTAWAYLRHGPSQAGEVGEVHGMACVSSTQRRLRFRSFTPTWIIRVHPDDGPNFPKSHPSSVSSVNSIFNPRDGINATAGRCYMHRVRKRPTSCATAIALRLRIADDRVCSEFGPLADGSGETFELGGLTIQTKSSMGPGAKELLSLHSQLRVYQSPRWKCGLDACEESRERSQRSEVICSRCDVDLRPEVTHFSRTDHGNLAPGSRPPPSSNL